MLNEINDIILIASDLRRGTNAYTEDAINKMDFSKYSSALKYLKTSGTVFARNSNINEQILIQDPKQYRRKSLDNLHYHEYYIDYILNI